MPPYKEIAMSDTKTAGDPAEDDEFMRLVRAQIELNDRMRDAYLKMKLCKEGDNIGALTANFLAACDDYYSDTIDSMNRRAGE